MLFISRLNVNCFQIGTGNKFLVAHLYLCDASKSTVDFSEGMRLNTTEIVFYCVPSHLLILKDFIQSKTGLFNNFYFTKSFFLSSEFAVMK